MAHGLEARSPFLDRDLTTYAASLPDAYKRRGAVGKVVLKEALRGLVPDDVLTRPKQGFGLPLGEWFRGELAPARRGHAARPPAARGAPARGHGAAPVRRAPVGPRRPRPRAVDAPGAGALAAQARVRVTGASGSARRRGARPGGARRGTLAARRRRPIPRATRWRPSSSWRRPCPRPSGTDDARITLRLGRAFGTLRGRGRAAGALGPRRRLARDARRADRAGGLCGRAGVLVRARPGSARGRPRVLRGARGHLGPGGVRGRAVEPCARPHLRPRLGRRHRAVRLVREPQPLRGPHGDGSGAGGRPGGEPHPAGRAEPGRASRSPA